MGQVLPPFHNLKMKWYIFGLTFNKNRAADAATVVPDGFLEKREEACLRQRHGARRDRGFSTHTDYSCSVTTDRLAES